MSDRSAGSPSSEQGSSYSCASAGHPSGVSLASDQGSPEVPTPAGNARRKGARKSQPNRPSKAAVCDNCRRRKIQCDLQTPCRACNLHRSACTYSGVDPAVRIERLLAIEAADVERTIALRDLKAEHANLLKQVDALQGRLHLSEDELNELYDTANERMLAEKAEFDKTRLRSASGLAAALPPAARGTALPARVEVPPSPDGPVAERLRPLKRERYADEDDSASEMPPPSAAAVREAQAQSQSRTSGRRRSLVRAVDEAPLPPNLRRKQPLVPPLPPIDPTGRPYPAAPYHFPRTYPMPPQMPMLDPPAWMAPLLTRVEVYHAQPPPWVAPPVGPEGWYAVPW
ncbi:hypothetical protein JCM10450v2_002607 [Rhodotorula kratochvilovae]